MENKENIHTASNTPKPYYEEGYDDEIDIKELVAKLWHKRKFILLCMGVFIVLGLVVAFTSPVSYTAESTVVPQMGDGGRGNLGGLASMMGVNVGASSTGETLSPAVYPQIINSVPFCKEIMETPIVIDKSGGEQITLYEYYTEKKYQPVNVIGTVKRYTIGLPGLLIGALRSDDEPVTVTDTITGKVITLTKTERRVIGNIKGSIEYTSNSKDGYITLGYSFSEPQATAVIAENIFATLEKYVTSYKSQKQQDNLDFVEESYEEARKDFMEKQARLAAFQDANRDLSSAMARTTERRLTTEYDVAYTVYNELARQREQAKIALKESTPVLTVIDPVVVPHEKSAPRRAIILIAFLFLGMIVSIGWVFSKPFLVELREELRAGEQ